MLKEIKSSGLTEEESRLLLRETAAIHIFSDVFTKLLDENGIPVDFDAELTTFYRLLMIEHLCTAHAIGSCQTLGAYAIELVANLLDLAQAAASQRGISHPDLEAAKRTLESKAIRVTANIAERSEETAETNGPIFYLAILGNGLEVYVTPISLLKYVADRVIALFEIANEGHPLFDGKTEQFRSSVIARSHQIPDHLVRVLKPCELIPLQRQNLELAYVDKFGNLRLRESVTGERQGLLVDYDKWKRTCFQPSLRRQDAVRIIIAQHEIRVNFARCLNDIPQGEWGLYRNATDGNSPYWELIYKDYEQTKRGGSWALLGKPALGSPVTVETVE
ncbi:MAG: hypothetical protein PVJ09_02075 [Candidatus Woesebacteria bacterium]|jgi:hypothetical protein